MRLINNLTIFISIWILLNTTYSFSTETGEYKNSKTVCSCNISRIYNGLIAGSHIIGYNSRVSGTTIIDSKQPSILNLTYGTETNTYEEAWKNCKIIIHAFVLNGTCSIGSEIPDLPNSSNTEVIE